MSVTDGKLAEIWNQTKIPVILRRDGNGERLRARLPFSESNRTWLQTCGKSAPVWMSNPKLLCWELPKSWFNKFVDSALVKYGQLYVIQPYREQEICARACMEATGHECQCSCMGAHHGSGSSGGWFEVSETFAVRHSKPELACRLMVARSSPPTRG